MELHLEQNIHPELQLHQQSYNMKEYILTKDGLFARLVIDGENTQIWHNTATNQDYLKWLSEGNTPLPADEPSEG